MIVPPMWNKESAAKEIGIVWQRARNAMLEARQVTVVGFSFTHLDRAAMDLLRSVLRENPRLRVDVYNGPNYDYADLERMVSHRLGKTGGRLDDLVGRQG